MTADAFAAGSHRRGVAKTRTRRGDAVGSRVNSFMKGSESHEKRRQKASEPFVDLKGAVFRDDVARQRVGSNELQILQRKRIGSSSWAIDW